ncbi:mitochondrial fission ELM1 family protein [Pseudoxanthomonas mexicana]|uniref:mitochondrial fission ELM1 family protein n=1 Tax=Pseudoxanthomonas mexicana TaxID=128785 RepID=UPI00398B8CAD
MEPIATWTLTDGRAGNARQAQALAEALALPARAWTLVPRAPWKWLSPRLPPGAQRAFGDAFSQALEAPPALAIGCGRQAALATRLLRRRGACVVQILHPRLDTTHWDWVIAPEHDDPRGANVIPLLGSLNPVDDAWLAQSRRDFPHLGELPGPRTALLLGGPSAHAGFDAGDFEAIADRLETLLEREGGSLMATASRRTPPSVRQALRARFVDRGLVWCDEGDGANPYPGLLAWADRIVCTPDSVNMLSEACATRAPVHVFDPARVRGRPRRFVDALLARGRIRALDAALSPFDAEPLRETARVAALLRERLRV